MQEDSLFSPGTPKVAFLGTAVIDRFFEVPHLPKPGDAAVISSSHLAYGGRGAGSAATFALLGGHAVLLSSVGEDFNSSGFEEFLIECGVDTTLVARETHDVCYSTNTYVESPTGEAYTFLEPRSLGKGSVPTTHLDAIRSADFLYVAGYYAHETIETCLDAAVSSGVATVVGLCNGLLPYVSDRLLKQLIESATVVSFNDLEWRLLRDRIGLGVADGLFELSSSLACIYHTRGSTRGIGYLRDAESFEIPVRPVSECRSTVGAGDTFLAAAIWARLVGCDYVMSARVGSTLASIKVETELGATIRLTQVPFMREELLPLLRQSGVSDYYDLGAQI